MKIWELWPDVNNFQSLTRIGDEEDPVFRLHEFEGNRIGELWKSPELEVYAPGRPRGDLLSYSTLLVLNARAVEFLRDLLEGNVELLPIKVKGDNEQYFLVNVVRVADCIDHDKAMAKRFSNSDKIMRFIKYAFAPDCVRGVHIFKVPELRRRGIPFVSDEFRERVLSTGMRGFRFDQVWDSEE